MSRQRAFTLIEVALIVAIIGMMLMMIIGYLFAPKEQGPLPPVAAPKPVLSSSAPSALSPRVSATPAPPAPPTSTPTQTIDPQSSPLFR